MKLLKRYKVKTVIDVGANVGQYAEGLRNNGYHGQIFSFEPLSEAHEILMAKSQGDSSWRVMERCAVGAEPGTTMINISENSVSSSILNMTEAHVDAAPTSGYVGQEEIEVVSLTQILPELLKEGERCHLKIDTQGYEEFVLKGSSKIMHRVSSVELELSLSEMYEGSWLAHDAINHMAGIGFRLYTVFPFFQDKATGETFQMDAIFVRA